MSKTEQKIQNRPERVWIYCRTGSQDENSLSDQRDKLTDFAKEQGWEIVGITAEHGSGLNYNRKGLKEVMKAAKAKQMDIALAKSTCRIGRITHKTIECMNKMERHGVKLIIADNGDIDFHPIRVAFYMRVGSEKQLQ
ncbi:MAG: hypothetical protein A4E52_00800 [Pelotomaculum sp. PtaB.Bin013]|uniref:Recombinase family protein n=1 Tax=Pelotomaculum isophthalicicum JI TaxID=947010 RepID=A0A9X4JW83_9FIRM|nr:recombinase family protein [Pelotomaculum isophthalicicum]MDF9409671.1 recombinase family protein [Pelotomaculum isophthalicicum JI]OPX90491.1 MAG: hypothetical protein A4E52_00800 [Pelotomaculum sp. PtaB.Bin013]